MNTQGNSANGNITSVKPDSTRVDPVSETLRGCLLKNDVGNAEWTVNI